MEQWIDISEYEGLYQVSNLGRVRRVQRGKMKEDRVRVLKINREGYQNVNLSRGGNVKTHLVHQLVANAFIVNPDNKPQVNHNDGNKSNNCSGNLEWATVSENHKHAFAMGIKKPIRGSRHVLSKLNEYQVLTIRKSDKKGTELAAMYGVSPSLISHIKNGTKWPGQRV